MVFEGTKATGVEVITNKIQKPGADQTPRIITARKLVVVSSGAIGSPIVLQRSGIGSAEKLSKIGVYVVVDLAGVGSNYEDHSSLLPTYHVANDTETVDPVMAKEPGVLEGYLPQFAHAALDRNQTLAKRPQPENQYVVQSVQGSPGRIQHP